MSKIMVSGSTGFIGSRLLQRLVDENHTVAILVRKNSNHDKISNIKEKLQIFELDGSTLNLVNIFKEFKPDITIHLASVFIAENKPEDVDSLVTSNVKFATQILEAMKHSNSKYFINTSSYAQHYNQEKYNPMNLYAATKEAFENIIKYYCDAYHFKAITLELFDTYGPNDTRNKILNSLHKYSLENISLDMSPGNQILDITHINDIIDAYMIAIDLVEKEESNIPKKYSLASENRIQLRDLVELYEKVTKQKVIINWGAREYRDREILIPWNKGEVLPGWVPKYSIEEGLKDSFCKGEQK